MDDMMKALYGGSSEDDERTGKVSEGSFAQRVGLFGHDKM